MTPLTDAPLPQVSNSNFVVGWNCQDCFWTQPSWGRQLGWQLRPFWRPSAGWTTQICPTSQMVQRNSFLAGKENMEPPEVQGWGGLSGEVGGKCRKPAEGRGEGKQTSSNCPHGPVCRATIRTKAVLAPGGRKEGSGRTPFFCLPSLGGLGEQLWDQPPPCPCWTLGQHVGAAAVNLNQGEMAPTPTSLGFLIPTAMPDG